MLRGTSNNGGALRGMLWDQQGGLQACKLLSGDGKTA